MGGGNPCPARPKGTMEHTVLIVDDNRFIVEGLHAILRKKGFRTISALSGAEALDLLSRVVPDLVLLDISMEPIDGWETLRRMRANPELTRVPVIVFSARRTLSEEVAYHHLNISEVLTKPINTSLLLEVITRVLSREEEAGGQGREGETRESKAGEKAGDVGLREEEEGEERPPDVDRKGNVTEEENRKKAEEKAGTTDIEEIAQEEETGPAEREPERNKETEKKGKKNLDARLLEFHISLGFEKHLSEQ
ncbi:MAG: response regulator [Methanolinea sp.]|nr:response regulator [Methanolinea sp.]